MSIQVHIERLVLEGLPPGHAHGAIIGAAAQAELARLLADAGAPGAVLRSEPRVSALPIVLAQPHDSRAVGKQIAGAVHQALTVFS